MGALALAALGASAAEPTKASLRLKWLPQAGYAGFYVAQAKGYFKDEGIDLTINPGGPNLLTENLVATGADTFGLGGGVESILAARDKNLPLLAIGMTHQVTPFVFVAKKDGPVKTIEDFKGKKATAWFTGSQLVLYGMLASKGIAPTDLSIQPQQVSVTPFVEGQVDIAAATFYNELLTIQGRVGADNLRIFVPEDYGVSFPRDVLLVSEKTAKERPDMVKGFLRATIKGWQDVVKDPKGAVDTVMKIAPTLDRAHQEKALTEALRLMKSGQAGKQGIFFMDMDVYKKENDLLFKAKVIEQPVDLTKAFDPSFLNSIPLAARVLP
ncbi:ABC transporter substrate-binding protein [Variovorax sp. UC122_21]|uniref:ABC transporter substrate-binding protein n=1 Tax=Variovorax sp. UC122_21 TaxID=3374554 RepID=UPI0037579C19